MNAILSKKTGVAALAGLVALATVGSASAFPTVSLIFDCAPTDGTVLYAADTTTVNQNVPPIGLVNMSTGARTWSCTVPLNQPHSAQRLANGNTLIADTGNNRVIEVDSAGASVIHSPQNALSSPTDARRLANGNTLIADTGNHRVIEVNTASSIVWQFGTTGVAGGGSANLSSPNKANRLANGNTLIADTGNNRVIEVDQNRQVVRTIATTAAAYAAARLANGNTLVAGAGFIREYNTLGQFVRTVATGDSFYDVELIQTNPGYQFLTCGSFGIRQYSSAGQIIASQGLD